MSGRKRTSPQKIDLTNEAKRISFCLYIPRERPVSANQPNTPAGPAQVVLPEKPPAACPQPPADIIEVENLPPESNGVVQVKKRRRKGKKKAAVPKQQPRESQFVPTLSEDTIATLPTVAAPVHSHRYSIPILHAWMPGPDPLKISLTRAEHQDSKCICIGRLCVSLDGDLPLSKLFSECGVAIKLSLELSEGISPMLRVSDGSWYGYVAVKEIAPPLSITFEHGEPNVCNLLSNKRWIRLAVQPISEDVPVVSELVIEAWAMETLCTVASPSEVVKYTCDVAAARALVQTLQQVHLEHFVHTPVEHRHTSLVVSDRLNQFYKDVQIKRNQSSGSHPTLTIESSSIAGLSAELRGYQCRAVEWMLLKEGADGSGACVGGGACEGGEASNAGLHKLWKRLPMSDQELYFNPFSGKFSKQHYSVAPWPKGGILADEMGLGKTVEVLALILAHPWSEKMSSNASEEDMDTGPVLEKTGGGEREESTQGDVQQMDAHVMADSSHQSVVKQDETRTQPILVDCGQPSRSATKPVTEVSSSQQSASSEVVQCLCGATSDAGYEGEFVQCEVCLVWFHSVCVDYCSQRHGEHFYCIRCLLEKPLPCGSTLIISPQAIAQQWMDEISKHTEPGAIKAFMYNGLSRGKFVSPHKLAQYDIVMVTYETLCTEFYHAMSHEMSKTLRKRKRYCYSPSPLPAVHWWRVCLDEAQMVESTNVRAAEMTKKLTAVNRWCVTGTPVQRQLLDLYGLLLFLNVDPYCHTVWFSRLAWEPYIRGDSQPMVDLFAQVMWRNSKADVASELCLPDHSEQVHWLTFSSVEAYFYKRQQEKCNTDLDKVIRGLSNSATLSSLVQSTFNKLMIPLHSLRQACCHPQLVRSGSYLPASLSNKTYITMPRLLEKLTTQAKVEAREALRQLVAALNGMAGMCIECDELETAVDYYREAMTVWQDHVTHNVDCDKLQRIHTLENLAELLEFGVETGGHTLRDSDLIEEAAALRSQCTQKVEGQVKAAVEGLFVLKNNISLAQRESNWQIADYLDEIPAELREEVTQPETKASSDQTTTEQSGEVWEETTADQSEDQPLVKEAGSEDMIDQTTATGSEGMQEETTEDSPVKESDSQTAMVDETGPETTVEQAETVNSLYNATCGQKEGDVQGGEIGVTDEEDQSESQKLVNHTGCDDQSSADATVDQSESTAVSAQGSQEQKDRKRQRPVVKVPKPIVTPSQPWWVSVCSWASDGGLEEELLTAVKTDFEQNGGGMDPYGVLPGPRFSDLTGVSYFLSDHADKTQSARHGVLSLLDELCAPPTDTLVSHASACHLRPKQRIEDFLIDSCAICVAESKTIFYERLLFSEYDHQHRGEQGEHGDGSRKPSNMERILRTMAAFANKQRGAPRKLQDAAQAFLSYLELLKKEYTILRTLWLSLDQRLRVHDELDMASTRLRVLTYYEASQGDFENDPFAVHPSEVQLKMCELVLEKKTAEHDLKKCLGQVLYLKNLAKKSDSSENSEPCPVCAQTLDKEWAVFCCGHPLCPECTSALIRQQPCHHYQSTVTVKCPLCREPSLSSEINYVRDRVDELQDISVEGCHSTKIAAIVRTLMHIQKTDSGAKCLVFSTWLEVLDLIASALDKNQIKYRFLKAKKTFQSNLSHFKSSPDTNVLLLPFHSGSKGLNIVEASHVLLVEPLLNLGAELQAIGRVHRMGQTRPTTVHRFLVNQTVEEKIFNMFNSQADKNKFLTRNEKESSLTLSDIRALVNI